MLITARMSPQSASALHPKLSLRSRARMRITTITLNTVELLAVKFIINIAKLGHVRGRGLGVRYRGFVWQCIYGRFENSCGIGAGFSYS